LTKSCDSCAMSHKECDRSSSDAARSLCKVAVRPSREDKPEKGGSRKMAAKKKAKKAKKTKKATKKKK